MSEYQRLMSMSEEERERELARYDRPFTDAEWAEMEHASPESAVPAQVVALRKRAVQAQLERLLAILETGVPLGERDIRIARSISVYLAKVADRDEAANREKTSTHDKPAHLAESA